MSKLEKITIDGQEYKLIPKRKTDYVSKKKTGYERVRNNTYYSRINSIDSKLVSYDTLELRCGSDDESYNFANYMVAELADDRARLFNLINQISRWQAENDNKVDFTQQWYEIGYSCAGKKVFPCMCRDIRNSLFPAFSLASKADICIEIFKDELTWYFTEYRSRLD